jgi:hypothetical protein
MHGSTPSFVQRVTVLLSTPNALATWPQDSISSEGWPLLLIVTAYLVVLSLWREAHGQVPATPIRLPDASGHLYLTHLLS